MDAVKFDLKRIKLEAEYGQAQTPQEDQSEWQVRSHNYRCTLRYKGRKYHFDYWMGQAHTQEPQVNEVLGNLVSDADAGQETFENFCANFGYDTDSRKAEAIWKACSKIFLGLNRLFRGEYQEMSDAVRVLEL